MLVLFRSEKFDLPSHLRFAQRSSRQSTLFRFGAIATLFREISKTGLRNVSSTLRGCLPLLDLLLFLFSKSAQTESALSRSRKSQDMNVRDRCGFREGNKAAFIPCTVENAERRATPSELLVPKWLLSER